MARSTRALVVTLTALVLLVVGQAAAAPGRTVVVASGESIQTAVDAAKPGDTIVVFGRHRENVAVVKDGLTLRGVGAVLEPPTTPTAHACFDPTVEGEAVHGICVVGDVDFETGEVHRYVEDVAVSGFTLRGFTGSGVFLAAARNAVAEGNVAVATGEAGFSAVAAPGARLLFNRATHIQRAGFFLFRAPKARLRGNVARDSQFGMRIGAAPDSRLTGNTLIGNCVGVFVDGVEGTAGDSLRLAANRMQRNTRACGADEDVPPLSGLGVVVFGAAGVHVVGNLITGNVPTGDTLVSGGVVVLAGPSGTPDGTVVADNTVLRNDPDVFWDGTGTGVRFRDNRCHTSLPPDICA